MLIGIAGTHGAGKGAVVSLLKDHGFIHCSARELFLDALKNEGVALPDRTQINIMANKLRAEQGVSFVVDEYTKRFNPVENDVIIESIYTQGEVDAIRNHGGFILAVDADPDIRYERISHRMSETDFVTKEEFIRKQEEEAHSSDPAKQNSQTVIESADFRIENNGTMEELRVQVDYMLEKIRAAEEQ